MDTTTETKVRGFIVPTLIKFSDAIREGHVGFRQNRQCQLVSSGGKRVCALAAGYVGLTGKLPSTVGGYEDYIGLYDAIKARCGIDIATEQVRSPRLDYEVSIECAVWDLNDSALWSFEQIADWLESEGY